VAHGTTETRDGKSFFISRLLNVNVPYSNYLCQVNGVNGRDTVFVRCVSVCVCLSGQSHQFKMVKAVDFKFDVHERLVQMINCMEL